MKPLIFFRGKGVGPTILAEKHLYDSRVVVKFNPTAYANSSNMLEWLDEQVVPILEDQSTILAMDLFAAHPTEEVLDTLRAHDLTVSVIPGGCTGLVQPLDVSINCPFKDVLNVIRRKKGKLTLQKCKLEPAVKIGRVRQLVRYHR